MWLIQLNPAIHLRKHAETGNIWLFSLAEYKHSSGALTADNILDALNIAAKNRHTKLVEYLLHHSLLAEHHLKDWGNAICHAIINRDVATLKLLLTKEIPRSETEGLLAKVRLRPGRDKNDEIADLFEAYLTKADDIVNLLKIASWDRGRSNYTILAVYLLDHPLLARWNLEDWYEALSSVAWRDVAILQFLLTKEIPSKAIEKVLNEVQSRSSEAYDLLEKALEKSKPQGRGLIESVRDFGYSLANNFSYYLGYSPHNQDDKKSTSSADIGNIEGSLGTDSQFHTSSDVKGYNFSAQEFKDKKTSPSNEIVEHELQEDEKVRAPDPIKTEQLLFGADPQLQIPGVAIEGDVRVKIFLSEIRAMILQHSSKLAINNEKLNVLLSIKDEDIGRWLDNLTLEQIKPVKNLFLDKLDSGSTANDFNYRGCWTYLIRLEKELEASINPPLQAQIVSASTSKNDTPDDKNLNLRDKRSEQSYQDFLNRNEKKTKTNYPGFTFEFQPNEESVSLDSQPKVPLGIGGRGPLSFAPDSKDENENPQIGPT